jgi:uncharacterized protein (TIGR04255 family)
MKRALWLLNNQGFIKFAIGSVIVREVLDPNREIYAQAPLMLVAFELRFTTIPGLESGRWEEVYAAIRESFPIVGPPPRVALQFSPGGAEQKIQGVRLLDRERSRAVAIYDESVIVETSAYVRFEELLELIKLVLCALHRVAPIPAVQRVGLRYIDEISVPEIDHDWSRYIDESLLCPLGKFAEFSPGAYSGTLELRAGEQRMVTLNYGVFAEPVVNPDGALRISKSPEGAYFLIDLDSFWNAPQSEFPEFQIQQVLEKCEQLHDPIRRIFEQSITDDLRSLMRGDSK